jgi:hypothetical protein
MMIHLNVHHIALIRWNSPLDPLRPSAQACASSTNDASTIWFIKAVNESVLRVVLLAEINIGFEDTQNANEQAQII